MYERILVGTDGSPTAARAVARAVEVARTTGASLTILAAADDTTGQRVVDAAVDAHASSGVAIDTAVVDGDAASVIVDLATDGGYDLVVVGNKGMTGVRRFFTVGAVPNKLAHHLPTNLLVVRTT